MPWVKKSDDHTNRPEIRATGPLGIAMDLAATCHANAELTDGFVSYAAAHTLLSFSIARADGVVYSICVKSKTGTRPVDSDWVIGLMLESGLWEEVTGGYRITKYHEHQPTADHVRAVRQKRREAGSLGGQSRAAHAEANQTAKQFANQDGSRNASNCPSPYPVSRVPLPEIEDQREPVASCDGASQSDTLSGLFSEEDGRNDVHVDDPNEAVAFDAPLLEPDELDVHADLGEEQWDERIPPDALSPRSPNGSPDASIADGPQHALSGQQGARAGGRLLLPDDWRPSEDRLDWTRHEKPGWNHDEIERQIKLFRAWYQGESIRCANWGAKWEMWVYRDDGRKSTKAKKQSDHFTGTCRKCGSKFTRFNSKVDYTDPKVRGLCYPCINKQVAAESENSVEALT